MTDIRPYSDRKQYRFQPKSWPIEDIVRAQQMACAGRPFDEIARELGCTPIEIGRIVDPEPSELRQKRAGMAYSHIKGR